MSVYYSAKSGGMLSIFLFRFFLNTCMKISCVFSLESPHRCTTYYYQYKKKIILNIAWSQGVTFSRTSFALREKTFGSHLVVDSY